MKSLLAKVWAGFKAPFVYVGLALLALGMVIIEAVLWGRRSEKRREAKGRVKDALDKVDAAVERNDPTAIRDDILNRTK